MRTKRSGILLFFLFGMVVSNIAFAQDGNVNVYDHEANIYRLKEAKIGLFELIVQEYDTFLQTYPENIRVHIEKCKFVENVYYEGEDVEEDALDQCLEDLKRLFPNDPTTLLYQSSLLYRDSSIVFLQGLLERAEEQPSLWADSVLWQLHHSLAEQYDYKDESTKALYHATRAIGLNDTLDLSLMMAEQYLAHAQKEEARRVLKDNLDRWASAWSLNQKGKLLLDLEEAEAAIDLFDRALTDTSAWVDEVAVGKALDLLNKHEDARRFFIKAEDKEDSHKSKEALFQHDLAYQPADSAYASYNRLRDLSYYADPFARQRVALFLKHPFLAWSMRDLLAVLCFMLLILALVCIPYVWILPIHYFGVYVRKRKAPEGPYFYHWSLRHFWYFSTLYLVYSFFVILIFNHTTLIDSLSDVLFIEEQVLSEAALADQIFFFLLAMAWSTVFFFKLRDWKLLWGNTWSPIKVGGIAFLTAFLLRIVFVIVHQVVQGGTDATSFFAHIELTGDIGLLTSREEITALFHQYGSFLTFLMIAVVVPVYEEIIFRGIILTSCERHIGFMWANLVQAVCFGLIHEETSYFLFFVITGLAFGYLRKESGGLGTSMVGHGINNFFVTLVYWLR